MSSMRATTVPLTPLQEGMVYHHLREGRGSGIDVVQVEVRLAEKPDPRRLRDAWNRVTAREQSLRLFAEWDGREGPTCRIAESADPPLAQVDLSDRDDPEKAFRDALHRDELRGFALDEPPLQRVTLYELSNEDVRLVWTLHHLIADGRSYALVLNQVFAILDGMESPGGAAPASFHDFRSWLEARDRRAEREFWTRALAKFEPEGPLPGERWTGATDRQTEPSPRRYLSARLDERTTDALRRAGERHDATLATMVQAAWVMARERFGAGDRVVFGTIHGGRPRDLDGADRMVGLFIQTLPIEATVTDETTVGSLLAELRAGWLERREHPHVPPADLQRWAGLAPGELPFRTVLNIQAPFWGDLLTEPSASGLSPRPSDAWQSRSIVLHNRLVYPLTVAVNLSREMEIRFEFDPGRMDPDVMPDLADTFERSLHILASDPDGPVRALEPLPDAIRTTLSRQADGGSTASTPEDPETIHGAFERAVARHPDTQAVRFGNSALTFDELDRATRAIAGRLAAAGVGEGDRVGVHMHRGVELVAALLGTLRSGAAYVPLDPDYPVERIRWIAEDSGLRVVLVNEGVEAPAWTSPNQTEPGPVVIEVDARPPDEEMTAELPRGSGDAAAYVLHTSGSTGHPKGVVVEHRNVLAFFRAMDEAVGDPQGQRWLALTSVSFDISVLELFWTLTRGATVVVHPERSREGSPDPVPINAGTVGSSASEDRSDPMRFSLFYFSSEGDPDEAAPEPGRHRYRLLLEGARIADEEGLDAIWTPERHFHEFGGIYPNPSIAGAALAAITRRIRIRAGSVVLPLHDPVRVAEEWAVIDNLSDGRVDLAFASGWHDRDFVFDPDAYESRRDVMSERIGILRRLWRGEAVTRRAPSGPVEVRVHPRPVQTELPIWITAGGSPDTFRFAGETGASLLTHLLGQRPAELAEKIALYREARSAAGHHGPGHVTLMLHTFLGEDRDTVRSLVRRPFREYLRSSVGLIKALAKGEGRDLRMAEISDDEMEALLDHAFERYFETSALMGTLDDCERIVAELQDRGVDEIACLVDFGVDDDATLASIRLIPELKRRVTGGGAGNGAEVDRSQRTVEGTANAAGGHLPRTVGEAIRRFGIDALQCTPSTARIILAGDADALGRLDTLLVGGEAFPGVLAGALADRLDGGRLVNMYGPTETTIWSAVHPVSVAEDRRVPVVPIGKPIPGTTLHVVDEAGRLAPHGVEGELLIGGEGVARGYLNRAEQTSERFVDSPVAGVLGRVYRTGDRVRRRADGVLEFRGRRDRQVKLRGHRIELGEIEHALTEHPDVAASTVVIRDPESTQDTAPASGSERLVGYLVPTHPSAGGGGRPDDADLRSHLRSRLPEVMVPSHFMWLEELPLTPNRKVDRSRLPEPASESSPASGSASTSEASSAPVPGADDDIGSVVLGIWKDVLERQDIGLDDNFFDVGGHSLLTIRVQTRLADVLGRKVSLTELFQYPTVRSLARHLGRSSSKGEDRDWVAGETTAASVGAATGRSRGEARRAALERRGGSGGSE